MNNISDQLAEEIKKMQQGNFNDYEQFYNMTAAFIGRMINDVIKDQTQSYQVMTEVYNTIYSRVGELYDLEQFYKWVGFITTNILAARTVTQLPENVTARENIYVAQYANEDGELIIPDKLMPDQRFRDMVHNMMEQFPLTHKLVMQYYYYEGKSVDEIAACLYKDTKWVIKIVADIKYQLICIVNQFPEYKENSKKSLAQMPVFWIIFAASVQIPVGIIAVAGTVAVAGAAGIIAGTAVGAAAGSISGTAAGGISGAAAGSISGTAAGGISGAIAGSGAAAGSISGTAAGGISGAVAGSGAAAGGISGAVAGSGAAAGGISGAVAGSGAAAGGISGAVAGSGVAAGGISGAAAATGTAVSGAVAATGTAVSGAVAATGTAVSGAVAATGTAATGAATGIFATVGAKVAVGVVVAALVAGGGATAYYVATKDKDEEVENTATEEAQAATDDIDDTTEAVTEEITEEVTEEGITEEEYAKLYLNVLAEYESQIKAYNQYRGDMAAGAEDSYSFVDSAPVAFSDITGDGVPELIFIYSAEDYINSIDIYTVNDDHAELIYEEEYWDVQAGGGSRYYLFKKENDDNLYARNGNSDEFTEENYYRFDVGDDGMLEKVELITSYTEPNDDYTGIIGTYTENGREIDEETYKNKRDELLRDTSELLLYNSRMSNEYGIYDYMYNAKQEYMTYDEAVEYLKQFVEEDETSEAANQENSLPFTDTQSFLLSSGAGAWGTWLELNPDGTFTGDYHDSNMGESGEGYDATVYLCTFSGRFKNIKKVNDYVYSMELDYVDTEDEIGTEWFEKSDDATVRYVASEPYGVYQGTTFYLYLPGISASELPEGFKNWAYYIMENDILTSYGLYNEDQELGFTGE